MNTTQPSQQQSHHKEEPLRPEPRCRRSERPLWDLEQAMDKARFEESVPRSTAPKTSPRWALQSKGVQNESYSVTWSMPSFGSIAIESTKHSLGKIQESGINAWAPLCLKFQAKTLGFHIKHQLAPGIRLLYCQKGKILYDVTNTPVPLFEVGIEWVGQTPKTTTGTGNYDVSLVMIDGEGTFIQLEVGVTTRGGRFWLSFQEVYAGQIARTTKAKAETLSVETIAVGDVAGMAVPLYAENARPDEKADFLTSNGMVHGVIAYGIENGFSKTLSRCSIGKWEPVPVELPPQMEKNGWVKATVLFFNLVWGQGFAILTDGTVCHLHRSKIQDEQGRSLESKGEFPQLNPMTEIFIRYPKGEKGGWSATAIRNPFVGRLVKSQ